ncbi:MAG: hypothetical protein HY234_15675 [Acidobacteria bacterium]|nr:hypothetical protein [Acidobacteriota bacterium]MBI3664474.1 hypothetical protein [Acidobacteriota bacterium]
MRPHRQRQRRAPGRRRAKRGGRPVKATPPEQSAAAAEKSNAEHDPIERAVEILASELPALVTTAVLRAKKGKPATLLRSVHRMVKELDTMIVLRKSTRPQEWERLKAFGPITGREALILGNLLELLRSAPPPEEASTAGGSPHPVWTPERIRAAQQEHDEQSNKLVGATRSPEHSPEPSPSPSGGYDGPDRRSHTVSTFFGKHERRRHRK